MTAKPEMTEEEKAQKQADKMEIANTIYHQLQVLNRQALWPFKFSDAVADDIHSETDLQVTIKKTSSYQYKLFVGYDYGSDTYRVRFGYSYTGNDFSRNDWGDFWITDWESDVYCDQLLAFAQSYWEGRKSLDYHLISDEWEKKSDD